MGWVMLRAHGLSFFSRVFGLFLLLLVSSQAGAELYYQSCSSLGGNLAGGNLLQQPTGNQDNQTLDFSNPNPKHCDNPKDNNNYAQSPLSELYPSFSSDICYQRNQSHNGTPRKNGTGWLGDGNFTLATAQTGAIYRTWHGITRPPETPAGVDHPYVMAVNSDGRIDSAYFRLKNVPVKPNTYYEVSAWFANLVKANKDLVKPNVTLRVIPDGDAANTKEFTTGKMPERSELTYEKGGYVIYTGSATSVTIELLNKQDEGVGSSGRTAGNDFVMADWELQECQFKNPPNTPALSIAKTVDKNTVKAGEEGVNYGITVSNESDYATYAQAEDIVVTDVLPLGFKPRVDVNGRVQISGPDKRNWSCKLDGTDPQGRKKVICTSSTNIPKKSSSSFNIVTDVSRSGVSPGKNVNHAGVSGGGDPSENPVFDANGVCQHPSQQNANDPQKCTSATLDVNGVTEPNVSINKELVDVGTERQDVLPDNGRQFKRAPRNDNLAPMADQWVRYEVTVTNQSKVTAASFNIEDVFTNLEHFSSGESLFLPEGVSLSGQEADRYRFLASEILPGKSETFSVVLKLKEGVNSIKNSAAIMDCTRTECQDEESTPVAKPNITKTLDPSTQEVLPGQNISYQVRLEGDPNHDTRDVFVSDWISKEDFSKVVDTDEGVVTDEGDYWKVTWNVLDLPAGGEVEKKLFCRPILRPLR